MLILIPPAFIMSTNNDRNSSKDLGNPNNSSNNSIGTFTDDIPHFDEEGHDDNSRNDASGPDGRVRSPGRGNRKTRGSPASLSLTNRVPFPMKLYKMLEDTERDGNEWICSWSADGSAFKVHNTHAFVDKIMPQYFRQTRYKSFQRQCHLYGYTRLSSGPNKGHYTHPKFIKNNRELCRQMIPLRKIEMEQQHHQEYQEHQYVGISTTLEKRTLQKGKESDHDSGRVPDRLKKAFTVDGSEQRYHMPSSVSSATSSTPVPIGGMHVFLSEQQNLPSNINFDGSAVNSAHESVGIPNVYMSSMSSHCLASRSGGSSNIPYNQILQQLFGGQCQQLDDGSFNEARSDVNNTMPRAMLPTIAAPNPPVSYEMSTGLTNLQILHGRNYATAAIQPLLDVRSRKVVSSSSLSTPGMNRSKESSSFSYNRSQQQTTGVNGLLQANQMIGYGLDSIQMNASLGMNASLPFLNDSSQHQDDTDTTMAVRSTDDNGTSGGVDAPGDDDDRKSNDLALFASALTRHEFPDNFDFNALEPRPFK